MLKIFYLIFNISFRCINCFTYLNKYIFCRELQKLLADERRLKEQLENQIEELKSKVVQLESQSGQKEQYEKKLRDARNELEAMRRKLKRAEAKAKETPPLLLELQEEMANMKMHHEEAIFEVQINTVDYHMLG